MKSVPSRRIRALEKRLHEKSLQPKPGMINDGGTWWYPEDREQWYSLYLDWFTIVSKELTGDPDYCEEEKKRISEQMKQISSRCIETPETHRRNAIIKKLTQEILQEAEANRESEKPPATQV